MPVATSRRPVLARTRAELAQARRALPPGDAVGAVFTMGALHNGHAALLRAARSALGPTGTVILTIFVNPLQFGAGEDLDRYPRTLEADLALASGEGVDITFAPSTAEMYPAGAPEVRVEPGRLGSEMEGAIRPGHFSGVLTVVAKLIGLTRPAVTFFGEKDYQQLVLVRRMVTDLDLGVEVVGVPTVREVDGLAMSSRNRYLGEPDRSGAVVLFRALRAGVAAGTRGREAVLAAARDALAAGSTETGTGAGHPPVVDYLELRSPDLNGEPTGGEARLLVAARFGSTRLIDNARVELATRLSPAHPAPPLASGA